jgi:DNA replication protein DnaC
MCKCLKLALAVESANESGFGEIIKTQNFKNFNLDYYDKSSKNNQNDKNDKDKNNQKTENSDSNSKDAGIAEEQSPYETMKTVYESCRNYAKKFGDRGFVKFLILMGKTGLGKTHLSSAIAGEIIKKGYDVYYGSAHNILYSFEKERFSYQDTLKSDIIERYMTCDLLIIDDLGTEYSGKMNVSSLYSLINMRLTENKGMIISTNLSYEEMRAKYDERIVSRIFGEFAALYFAGNDVRFIK